MSNVATKSTKRLQNPEEFAVQSAGILCPVTKAVAYVRLLEGQAVYQMAADGSWVPCHLKGAIVEYD